MGKDIQRTYYKRYHNLKDQRDVSNAELIVALENIKEANNPQFARWANIPKGQLPPVEAMGILAHKLKSNVGYLIGQNDVRDFAVPSGNVCLSIDTYERICEEKTGKSLMASKTCGQVWIQDMKSEKRKLHRIAPLLKISDALDVGIDFVLGLTKNRYLEYDLLEQKLFDFLPENIELVIDTDGKAKYCRLSDDGTRFYLATGEDPVPKEDITAYSPKLCDVIIRR